MDPRTKAIHAGTVSNEYGAVAEPIYRTSTYAFASIADTIDGFDLSPGMIERARATQVYRRLEVADMVAALQQEAAGSAELILAADAMVYVADLAPVLAEAVRVLVAGGTLAFTVETHAGNNGSENGSGIVLGEGLRYAHSAAYVGAAVEAAGLKLAHREEASVRNEANAPVRSLIVVVTRG